jgi:hypothetical protein
VVEQMLQCEIKAETIERIALARVCSTSLN